MDVSLIGAELEENLGLRYIASSLESKGHTVSIIPFNDSKSTLRVAQTVSDKSPDITCLSMVFTVRGKEFCDLARALRECNYSGHINAGGPFAAFNAESLLRDYPYFDSIALGEGEGIICSLAENLNSLSGVPGLCYREENGSITTNPSVEISENLDLLPFPKRSPFPTYLDKPIASLLSSRGCWRNCAFCSIHAWYRQVGSRNFRVRSIENLVKEMKSLYFQNGVRIFNFQDDNFFLPDKKKAYERFVSLKSSLETECIDSIGIAIKARPDSITNESVDVLDQLGLFRVFLGVENGSENGLKNLNRRQSVDHSVQALKILNDYDVHVAYNLLLFEPDTKMDDIADNLQFIERHIDNPFNFCRAEVHACTGLEEKLKMRGALEGNYFQPDYRISDPEVDVYHKIANYAFFNRNFADDGLHYFSMELDFYFQMIRRFHPDTITRSLRSSAKNFVKKVNLDTYQVLSEIYDFVETEDRYDQSSIKRFSRFTRERIDDASAKLHAEGLRIQQELVRAYEGQSLHSMFDRVHHNIPDRQQKMAHYPMLFRENEELTGIRFLNGILPSPIPYHLVKDRLSGKR